MTAPEIYPYYLQNPILCFDTRKIKNNPLFFCLRGEHNGNKYAKEALRLGASFVIMDDPIWIEEIVEMDAMEKVFQVEDSLETLQDLAKIHRSKMTIPVIGITGSNGKTTSKEIIRSILSERFQVFATEGNLNNHIGVPLSILSIEAHHEIAIIEMGANHQKEIEQLCSMARPTHGLITNIGKAHLEGFGGIKGIMKGKKELYDYLKLHTGTAFVYTGDTRLMMMLEGLEHLVYYGSAGNEDVVGKLVQEFPYLELSWHYKSSPNEVYKTCSKLTGAYNLANILGGVTIGHYFKLEPEEISKGIEKYAPTNNRSQIRKSGGYELIMDFYNANPDSMKVALENFKDYPATFKMAILGDMFELGEESDGEHKTILNQLLEMKLNSTLLIGINFEKFREQYPNFLFAKNLQEAVLLMKPINLLNYTILLKGSRGMKLENLLSFFDS